MLEVIKAPAFEGDSFLISLRGFRVGALDVPEVDRAYYMTKLRMFEERDLDPDNLTPYAKERPSLRTLESWRNLGIKLTSTNYAYAADVHNNRDVETLLAGFARRLGDAPDCRRCVLRLANPGLTYLGSTVSPEDVSCTLAMHFTSGKTSVMMRASDVRNELVPDLLLARDFFASRVFLGQFTVDIEVFASTAQNIDAWENTMSVLEKLTT